MIESDCVKMASAIAPPTPAIAVNPSGELNTISHTLLVMFNDGVLPTATVVGNTPSAFTKLIPPVMNMVKIQALTQNW